MKTYGNGGVAPRTLNLDIRWRRVVSITFRGKSPPVPHWLGGRVGPKAGLDAVPPPGIEHRSFSP
jgi:hypothetical protein